MKHAQMEIMGLAIIVILLVLGMLFVIGVIIEPSEDLRASYTYEKIASNSLNSLLKTSSGCLGLDIRGLLRDCGGERVVDCKGDGMPDSCETADFIISKIFNETITSLNKKYYFHAGIDIPETKTVLTVKTDECLGERKAADPFPIRTSAGLMTINFYVCG